MKADMALCCHYAASLEAVLPDGVKPHAWSLSSGRGSKTLVRTEDPAGSRKAIILLRGPNAIRNFHVVETRNTLTRDEFGTRGDINDWLNKIHLNATG